MFVRPDTREEVLRFIAGNAWSYVQKTGHPIDRCTFEVGDAVLAAVGMTYDELKAEIVTRVRALALIDPRIA